jgi:hypothetical protein
MYNGDEKKHNYYLMEKIRQKACNVSKHRNYNAWDKKVLKFVLHKDKNGLPLYQRTKAVQSFPQTTVKK